jgi:hypothetical protein
MKRTVFIGGAHRGGRAITDAVLEALPGPGIFDQIVIADPKEDRAAELARVWQTNGVEALGLDEPCEKAVKKIEADSILLAIDTIRPMGTILETDTRPTQWQMLCRGPGENGPVLGMSGSIHEGNSENRDSSVKLIKEMGSFIKPQSSSAIRENLLNADTLHVMRTKVSRHSAGRLGLLDREPKDLCGGALNLFWGGLSLPLAVQTKPANQRWRETKEQVMSTDLPQEWNAGNGFAVATVGNKNIDFFIVEENRGRRSVRFHMPLVHTLPQDSAAQKASLSGGVLAALALGIGMLAIAPLVAGAVVTD